MTLSAGAFDDGRAAKRALTGMDVRVETEFGRTGFATRRLAFFGGGRVGQLRKGLAEIVLADNTRSRIDLRRVIAVWADDPIGSRLKRLQRTAAFTRKLISAGRASLAWHDSGAAGLAQPLGTGGGCLSSMAANSSTCSARVHSLKP